MLLSEHTLEKTLTSSLSKLNIKRDETEKTCMFRGEDEEDTTCTALREDYAVVQSEAEKVLGTIDKNIIHKLKRRVPGSASQHVKRKYRYVNEWAGQLTERYRRSSEFRSSFRAISNVAYMPKPPNGYRKIRCSGWQMRVDIPQQMPNTPRSPWTVLEYDEGLFLVWWQKRLSICKVEEQEWKDMQALCSVLILLFERLTPTLMGNPELGPDLNRLQTDSQSLAYTLCKLMAYPEHFSSTSALVGYTAVAVFLEMKWVCTILDSLTNETTEIFSDGGNMLGFYERQVKLLCEIVRDLADKSNFLFSKAVGQEERAIPLLDDPKATITSSLESQHGETSCNEVDKAETRLKSHKWIDAKDIKRLGIPEILLSTGTGRQIGFGSSAVVFERFAREGSVLYAVKEPSGMAKFNRDALWNKFGREAQVWRLLKHENILPLRGFCVLSNDLPGLVTDAHRWNLRDFLGERPQSSREKMELLHGASSGVSYLHSQNIAHGDLRSCNLLVKENALRRGFTALLADFGTAYFVNGATDPVERTTRFKATCDQVGNVGWLSPELLRRKVSQDEEDTDLPIISIPGDIYSFGCVFLEVIYERDPYQGCNSDEMKKEKILQGLPPASLEETSHVYHEFLCSMWNVDPGLRPSAESITSEIDKFLQCS